jgi:hypothetical protein
MVYAWISLMAATVAVNTIFVITLLAGLSWEQRSIFLSAAILLAGGLWYTIRTMLRLTKSG